MPIKLLTFEGSSFGGIQNITTPLKKGRVVLVNFRFDCPSALNYNSVSLEIGNLINSNNVIDNDPKHFYVKVPLSRVPVNIGGTDYSLTYEQPNLAFEVPDIQQQLNFFIRDNNGNLVPNTVTYWCFNFVVYSDE